MKLVFLTAFTVLSLSPFAQNITFDQAQNLRKKNLADVESFLTAKGWAMTDASEATDDKMGRATFGYGVDRFDSEKALGWISFYESKVGSDYNRLSIQVHKSNIYTTFLTRLTANGYKLKKSKIIDGGIEKVYKNATTTCVVTTSTSEGTFTKSTSYLFFFIENLSYKLNYEDEDEE